MHIRTLIAIVAALAFAPAAFAETPSAPAAPVPPAAAVAAVAAPSQPAAPVAPVAPAPGAAQSAAPVARREDIERPTLASRVKALLTTNTGTAQLIAQVGTLTKERDDFRAQLGAITKERDDLRTQLAEVETALSGQQNLVKATATEIANTVGIPLDRLPAPQATGSALEDLQDKLKGEQNAHKRSEIMAQIIALRDKK